MDISRAAVVACVLILASTMLDVVSTQVGVLVLGNGEAGPVARYVIGVLGSRWWLLYFPYESGALLLSFFILRIIRRKMSERFRSSLLQVQIEYIVIIVSYATVANNAILLLQRVGRL